MRKQTFLKLGLIAVALVGCISVANAADLQATTLTSPATQAVVGHPIRIMSIDFLLNGTASKIDDKTVVLSIGDSLKAIPGTLDNPDKADLQKITYTYQWQTSSDGTTWSSATGVGATTATYTIDAKDKGLFIRVMITPSSPEEHPQQGTPSLSVSSANKVNGVSPNNHFVVIKNSTGKIVNGNIEPLVGRAFDGSLTPDSQANTLSVVVNSKVDGSGTDYPSADYDFQWQSTKGGATTPIAGATNITYTPRAQDQGATLSVVATVK